MNEANYRSPDAELFVNDPQFAPFRSSRSVVTGGLGFIPSNLVHALTLVGSSVTVVDSLSEGQGGNRFNLKGIEDTVDVRIADIRDEAAMADAIAGADYVFNMAASVSHLDSLNDPFHDLDVNVRGHLVVLEAIRKHAPDARVIYSGTRSEYGLIQSTPVSETHPLLPTEVNSANKAVGDMYHVAYHVAHGLKSTSLRLTNTYGPRMLVAHHRQGFINWFVRLAVEGGTFRLYGDGTQVRDLVYVDDMVRAFLIVAVTPSTIGQSINVGSGNPTSLLEIAKLLVDMTGRGNIEYVPFPEDARRIEIGDYVADTTRITEMTSWKPQIKLREGLERSVRYFTKYREHYW